MTKLEPDKENGLTKISAADSFQIRSVSQERFVKQIGTAPWQEHCATYEESAQFDKLNLILNL
jgi:hypothetical protein